MTSFKTRIRRTGATYTLTVQSLQDRRITEEWPGFGSTADARRWIPAAQILVTAKVSEAKGAK